MQPPRPIFVIVLLAALAVAGGAVAFEGFKVVRNEARLARIRTVRREPEAPVRVARASREEPAASATKPLPAAVDALDFAQDPAAYDAFAAILQSRLRQGDYEAVEVFGARIQKERRRLPGGGWMVQAYLDALGEPPEGDKAPDQDWVAHHGRLRAWVDHHPNSTQGPVVSGCSLVNQAWAARGTGFAHEVTRGGWKDFETFMAQARSTLESVPERDRGAGWYCVMLRVALGQSWSRGEYDALFDRAVAVEPRFQGFYQAKANYLLPRWHGQEGEWQAFAMQSAARLGGAAGDEVFVMVELSQAAYEGDGIPDWRKVHSSEWPRMKRGFEALRKEFGPSIRLDNQELVLTTYAGDRAEAKRLAEGIGDRFDRGSWYAEDEFKDFRDWALCRGRYASKP